MKPHRAGALLAALLLAAFACHAPRARRDAGASSAPARPNFLVILCDDLGYADLSCYGSARIRTPNADRLAREGTLLTTCLAAAPVCSPSRAGLLTGRVPTRAGIHDWIALDHPMHLRAGEATVASVLRDAGYATCLSGKWHLNGGLERDDQPQPGDHGFDHWFATQNNAFPSHHNPENFVRDGAPAGQLAGYACDIVAEEAIAWLERGRDRERPFFLLVSFHEPHEPIDAPESILEDYLDAPARGQALYEACVANVDRATGRLLAAIDRLSLRDDTFVLFTSDNGPEPVARYDGAWRSHGEVGALRGKKLSVYEGGIRVPGIVRFPGRVRAGDVSDEPVSFVDLLPTLCDYAGVPLPPARPLDGASARSALEGGRAMTRAVPLRWYYFRSDGRAKAALRDGRWKLVGLWDGPELEPARSVQPGDAETIAATRLVEFELYDLRTDPGEARNLAESEPERCRTMAERLSALTLADIAESPCWEIEDEIPLD
jgi:arylsulfatase A